MNRHLDRQMQEIRQRLAWMGSLVESMISHAVRSLIDRNARRFEEVGKRERQVNDLQLEIDDMAVKIAALRQPVGTDVRFLFTATRITSELERIADQAVNICESARFVLQSPPLKPFVDIPVMTEIARKMVRESLEAMVRKDSGLAREVLREDEKVDAFRDRIFRELLTYMMADPGTIPRALSLILIFSPGGRDVSVPGRRS